MLKLRRWMTEILLEVTTSMMNEVSSEVITRAKLKGMFKHCCQFLALDFGGFIM